MITQTVTSKPDLYKQITQTVIEAIEAGADAYRMPWHNLESPVNATNQKPYRGTNSVVLWALAQKHGYVHPQWATYRQWRELRAHVRKGARSATVVFWKFFDKRSESDALDTDEEEQAKSERRCMARAYPVFNAAQVEGYASAETPLLSSSERIAAAEAFFSRLSATVKHGGDRAFYSVSDDYIQMPTFEQFQSAESYYSVRSHESTHNAVPRIMPRSSLRTKQDVVCDESRRHNLVPTMRFGNQNRMRRGSRWTFPKSVQRVLG